MIEGEEVYHEREAAEEPSTVREYTAEEGSEARLRLSVVVDGASAIDSGVGTDVDAASARVASGSGENISSSPPSAAAFAFFAAALFSSRSLRFRNASALSEFAALVSFSWAAASWACTPSLRAEFHCSSWTEEGGRWAVGSSTRTASPIVIVQ